jgi:phosphoribosyl-ATP pyrophosphohydrolase
MLKASEEFQELALALTQKSLKKIRIPNKAVTDEMGDAFIRLAILLKMPEFPLKEVMERIDYKLNKFKEYQDKKLYSKI